jgi:hypothetical protein
VGSGELRDKRDGPLSVCHREEAARLERNIPCPEVLRVHRPNVGDGPIEQRARRPLERQRAILPGPGERQLIRNAHRRNAGNGLQALADRTPERRSRFEGSIARAGQVQIDRHDPGAVKALIHSQQIDKTMQQQSSDDETHGT